MLPLEPENTRSESKVSFPHSLRRCRWSYEASADEMRDIIQQAEDMVQNG